MHHLKRADRIAILSAKKEEESRFRLARTTTEEAVSDFHETLDITALNGVPGVEIGKDPAGSTVMVGLNLTRQEVALAKGEMQELLKGLGIDGKARLNVDVRLSSESDPGSRLAALSLTLKPYGKPGNNPGIKFGAENDGTLDPLTRAEMLRDSHILLQEVFERRRQLVPSGEAFKAGAFWNPSIKLPE